MSRDFNNVMGFHPIMIIISLFYGCAFNDDHGGHSPAEEQTSFRFADQDLQISLVTAEPDVVSPVAMAWSPDGSLFVAEMPGYPITEYTGRIKKLHDPDGDGYYELASVFAEELNFPNSVMWYDGGILVTDAPDIIFLKDTDHDGVADTREVVLSGFNPGNEQLRVNSLYWGLDNWIYGANGRSGGMVYFSNDSTAKISIDNRDFRFSLDPKQLEAITGMSQYGVAHDDWGNRFISYNHRFARQVMLEESHLLLNPALAVDAVYDTYQSEHDRRVFTLLPDAIRFNRDPIGYFTSLSGLFAYNGQLLEPAYIGDLFAGESVQAAVVHRRLESDGPVYKAIDIAPGVEFLASSDSWFHPVNFANGPDGALYMVDFYRLLVEHPQWAQEDRREGVNWKLGEENGRIWRITNKNSQWEPARMKPGMGDAGPLELAEQLEDPSGWRRDMARQLLLHKNLIEAGPTLEQLLGHEKPETRVQALWTLNGLGLLAVSHIENALKDEVPQIIVQGIRLTEARKTTAPVLIDHLNALATSNHGLVRFHAILALGYSNIESTRKALISSWHQYNDPWTRIALLSSVSQWADDFSRILLTTARHNATVSTDDLSFYRQLGTLVASRTENWSDKSWINSLINGSTIGVGQTAFLTGYMEAANTAGRSIPGLSTPFFDQMLQLAGNQGDTRQAQFAIELLRYSRSAKVHHKLLHIVLNSPSQEVKFTGLNTLAWLNDAEISTSLFENLSSFGPATRERLISSSLSSDAAALSLLAAIENENIDPTEISEELRQALLAHSNESIRANAESGLGGAVNSNRQAVVDQYLASLNSQTVDLESGAAIFINQCSVCHAVNGRGGLLGPDLTNIGSRSDEVLLVNILDPSRMVSYELRLHVIVTKAGEIFTGTISSESASSLTVRQPDGKEHTILREHIQENTMTDQSIMPEGFERMINEKGMADLIGFLRQPVDITN